MSAGGVCGGLHGTRQEGGRWSESVGTEAGETRLVRTLRVAPAADRTELRSHGR